MARYRVKDETDLRWNAIRREITRNLDTQIATWREATLNVLIGDAWDKYAKSLESGDRLELESHYENFVAAALSTVIEGVVIEDAAAEVG